MAYEPIACPGQRVHDEIGLFDDLVLKRRSDGPGLQARLVRAAVVFRRRRASTLEIGDYDGNWWDMRTGVTWMYNRHVGVSAGYEKFITQVNVTKPNFNGSLNLGYSGLLLNVTATF